MPRTTFFGYLTRIADKLDTNRTRRSGKSQDETVISYWGHTWFPCAPPPARASHANASSPLARKRHGQFFFILAHDRGTTIPRSCEICGSYAWAVFSLRPRTRGRGYFDVVEGKCAEKWSKRSLQGEGREEGFLPVLIKPLLMDPSSS